MISESGSLSHRVRQPVRSYIQSNLEDTVEDIIRFLLLANGENSTNQRGRASIQLKWIYFKELNKLTNKTDGELPAFWSNLDPCCKAQVSSQEEIFSRKPKSFT